MARPQIDGLDFSFSGLKTSFLYFLRDALKEDPNFVTSNLSDLCASLQERIVDILIDKLERAAKETGISQIAIAGGVAANSGLRQRLLLKASQHDWRLFIPKLEYCTDNAAMIGIVGYYKNLKGDFADPEARPDARLTWND